MDYLIRKPTVTDVPAIHELILVFAEQGLMLGRSLSDLYDRLREFQVACPADQPELVVGVCALHICWADLGEIRSLSVAPGRQGTDLGRRLLAACEAEGRLLGLHRLFVLTYIPDYFAKAGFDHIDKAALPHKIWADCLNCVKFPECGEVALARNL